MKPIRSDKLPNQYREFVKTVGFSEPVHERGEILKEMAKHKLKIKFRDGIKHKMDQLINAYEEK